MNSLPECIRNKIWNYAAEMMIAERNKKWEIVNDQFLYTLCQHVTPYIVLDPEVLMYCVLRPGPFKHIVDSVVIKERCP